MNTIFDNYQKSSQRRRIKIKPDVEMAIQVAKSNRQSEPPLWKNMTDGVIMDFIEYKYNYRRQTLDGNISVFQAVFDSNLYDSFYNLETKAQEGRNSRLC